jgi:uncharacterized protein (TIGR00375 family)
MRFFADLHFHSKYSRACSKNLDLEHLFYWAQFKGLNLLATADYTHPAWFQELKQKLDDDGSGFFKLKPEFVPEVPLSQRHNVYFVLSCEISSIFSRAGSVKRIHYLILFPDFASVEKLNQKLSLYSKLSSDGRPMLGLDVKEVLKMALDINDKMLFIPAHIWTPWFSLFGSMSGFNSIFEAFGDLTKFVPALETGLSSDPKMNWRLSQLDDFQIVSFSDAHSPQPHRIGREATVFELEQPNYDSLAKALKHPSDKNRIDLTVEFYPEEGKYHYDGHRLCGICFSPTEAKKHNYICPNCNRRVTVGVMSRIEELADRPENFQSANRPAYKNIVPLTEIIAEALGSQPTSKRVIDIYITLIREFGNEFNIFLNDIDFDRLVKIVPPSVQLGLKKFKTGELYIKPGYDGEYGVVRILGKDKDVTAETMIQTTKKSLF